MRTAPRAILALSASSSRSAGSRSGCHEPSCGHGYPLLGEALLIKGTIPQETIPEARRRHARGILRQRGKRPRRRRRYFGSGPAARARCERRAPRRLRDRRRHRVRRGGRPRDRREPRGCPFVVEEDEVYELTGTSPPRGDDEVWVIDPLDGTTSFVHGYPCYSVSVAMLRQRPPVAGAVYNAGATRCSRRPTGSGRTATGRRLGAPQRAPRSRRSSSPASPTTAATARPPARAARARLAPVHGIRRDGSAAIDCCHVARTRGRLLGVGLPRGTWPPAWSSFARPARG